MTTQFHLVDTTLRDGEQTPGVAFSRRRKQHLASRLSQLGVSELEVGIPAMGDGEVATIRSLVDLNLPSRLTAWCRASVGDLEAAARAGVSAVHLSLPTSKIHMQLLDKSHRWLHRQIELVVSRAVGMFEFVSVGAQDASRADQELLIELARALSAAGANRFRLADTVGVWSPPQVIDTITAMRVAVPDLPLGFHAHNDLGMATANTLAAVSAGATSADVTVLGIGERAGNAALEEVVLALRHVQGLELGIQTESLSQLAQLVARYAGQRIACNKPIVGRNAFCHESGIHVHGMLRNPQAYQPFAADEVGAVSQMVLGRHAGSTALQHVLQKYGLRLSRGSTLRWVSLMRCLADHRVVRRLFQHFAMPLAASKPLAGDSAAGQPEMASR